MTLGEAIYNELAGTSAVTALVGNRIYRKKLPQNTSLPAISIHFINEVPVHAMGNDPSLYHEWFQVSIWVENDLNTAESIKAVVLTALRDFSGTLGGDGGVTVQRIFHDGGTQIYEPETKTDHIPIEFEIWYEV